MPLNEAILLTLTGGVKLKMRVHHPQVHQRADRKGTYWFFRYWHDELLPNGKVKTSRKFHTIGPSKGENKLSKREAEAERDKFLSQLNAAPTRAEAAVQAHKPPEVGAILFGKLAEMWREDYANNPKIRLAEPTRIKYNSRLDCHILPRWKDTRIAEMRSKEILDWLHATCTSWHMMVDLRNVMSGIFTKAQEWEIMPETFGNPMNRVKIGRKWVVRPERILSEQETMRVLALLEDPQLLICETCLSTGARISEVLGLQRKHLDLAKGVIEIRQRHCRGDIDVPKTKNSRRTLTLGSLTARFTSWVEKKNLRQPDQWLFAQDEDPSSPMWDSGVRKALKIAAAAAGCDFKGLGLHSFRRANITWRQEVG
ncbi:MAG: tyrosine-type recombinase/integrase, partial [Acidobacteria bacterium]|nr:tyrosine-type recombinase/integrase [Acidobacteriota bacterium]